MVSRFVREGNATFFLVIGTSRLLTEAREVFLKEPAVPLIATYLGANCWPP
jgi:hypothetical protein